MAMERRRWGSGGEVGGEGEGGGGELGGPTHPSLWAEVVLVRRPVPEQCLGAAAPWLLHRSFLLTHNL